jgi:Aminoacyl-tRNA editing domain
LSAAKVAGQVGLPPQQVFKTLVAKGDVQGIVLAVVPADRELDLKALGKASGLYSSDPRRWCTDLAADLSGGQGNSKLVPVVIRMQGTNEPFLDFRKREFPMRVQPQGR